MVVRKQGSCEDLRESCTRKETRLRPPTIVAHFTRYNKLVPRFSRLLVEK